VDGCCEYKGIFTNDQTCPLVYCYDYEKTMQYMQTILLDTIAEMETTNNATEVRAASGSLPCVSCQFFFPRKLPGLCLSLPVNHQTPRCGSMPTCIALGGI
jgi:hypothetical protein